MAAGTSGDPRLALPPAPEGDVRPVVAPGRTGPSIIAIGIVLAVAGLLLFLALDSRRRTLDSPAVRIGSADRGAMPGRDIAPLYVPPAWQAAAPASASDLTSVPAQARAPAQSAPVRLILPQPPRPARSGYSPPQFLPPEVYAPPPPSAAPWVAPEQAEPSRGSGSPALVIDLSGVQGTQGGPSAGTAGAPETPAAGASPNTRAAAGILANRATTVPQGTLIPAVLETALDSTRPGYARAIVSRDVRGFDGRRILIPRGSRVVGEYAANAAPGQNRAIINWSRLVRPDGVTILLASPATDSLGRGGVRASVNSHFLARFGAALLQTALDVGVGLARPDNGAVVLALPGSAGGGANRLLGGEDQQPPRTLKVRAGTSIAIFVARDLDFTGVGNPR